MAELSEESVLTSEDIEADTDAEESTLQVNPQGLADTAKPCNSPDLPSEACVSSETFTKIYIQKNNGTPVYLGMQITGYPFKIRTDRLSDNNNETIAFISNIKSGDYLLAVDDQDVHFLGRDLKQVLALFQRIQTPCVLNIIVHRTPRFDEEHTLSEEKPCEMLVSAGCDLATDGPPTPEPCLPVYPIALEKKCVLETDGHLESTGSDVEVVLVKSSPQEEQGNHKEGSKTPAVAKTEGDIVELVVNDEHLDLQTLPPLLPEMPQTSGLVANRIRKFDKPEENTTWPSVESTVRAFEARALITENEAPPSDPVSYKSIKIKLIEDLKNEVIVEKVLTEGQGRYTELLTENALTVSYQGNQDIKIYFEHISGIHLYLNTDKNPVFSKFETLSSVLWDMNQYRYFTGEPQRPDQNGFPVILASKTIETDQLDMVNTTSLAVTSDQDDRFQYITAVDDRFFQRQGFSTGNARVFESVTRPFHFIARSLLPHSDKPLVYDSQMIYHTGPLEDENNPLSNMPENAKFICI